jgi:hypothetical protein
MKGGKGGKGVMKVWLLAPQNLFSQVMKGGKLV